MSIRLKNNKIVISLVGDVILYKFENLQTRKNIIGRYFNINYSNLSRKPSRIQWQTYTNLTFTKRLSTQPIATKNLHPYYVFLIDKAYISTHWQRYITINKLQLSYLRLPRASQCSHCHGYARFCNSFHSRILLATSFVGCLVHLHYIYTGNLAVYKSIIGSWLPQLTLNK